MPNPANLRLAWLCLIVFVSSQLLFLWNLELPFSLNFDEVYYVLAAREWTHWGEYLNSEHPPLAKMLIALGISIFGDSPIGWRMASSLFGSLTLVGAVIWAWSLLQRMEFCLWVAFFSLFNQLLFVFSRTAMLDVFMCCFMIWAFVPVTLLFKESNGVQKRKRLLTSSGVLFALGTACKWFALIPWGLSGLFLLFQSLKEKNWQTIRSLSLCFFIIPLGIYFATFLPILLLSQENYTFFDIFSLQWEIWTKQKTVHSAVHTYNSHWSTWFLMIRPVWFYFEEIPQTLFTRNIIFLGNPVIIWGGVLALLYCFKKSITSFPARVISISWCSLYLSWAFIQRDNSFFYYYYPASIALGFAMAYSLVHLKKNAFSKFLKSALGVTTLVAFIFFYPVLTAIPVPKKLLPLWTWFSTWI